MIEYTHTQSVSYVVAQPKDIQKHVCLFGSTNVVQNASGRVQVDGIVLYFAFNVLVESVMCKGDQPETSKTII